MFYVIGIDPGVTGAVAVITLSSEFTSSRIQFFNTPVELEKRGRKQKLEFRPIEMANILALYPAASSHTWIEQVSAMPGQGVTSMFGFGKGYGMWLGILAALKMPHSLVTPQRWKKEMMAGMGDKDAARGRLQQLYPQAAMDLNRKKDIGRADAGLIAEYGRRTLYKDNIR